MNWLRRQLMRPPATATPAGAGPSSRSGTVFIARTPESFAYDADGNMTSDGRFHYYWNGENRLVCASNAEVVVTYAYDHRGRMVAKTLCSSAPLRLIKTTTYIWDNWNIIREIVREGDSVAVTDNVWGLDLDGTLQGAGGVGGLLAVIRSNSNSNSSLYFPTFDANGNISEYISTNGEIVAHYDYSPFGEPLVSSGPLAATFTHQFSTKPYCPVTGFSEYQMRKYNPTIGRWMNRDPIGEDGGMGLYCYASNMPICEADYIGLSIGEWGIWPWNWFNGADSCLSEFTFEDKGQEYANTMRETTLLYDTLFVTPAENVIYHRAIKKKPDFGFTLTDFNKVGYACCCDKLGQYTPAFLLSAFTKTYILNADAAYWNDKKRRFNDPRVDLKWRGSTRHQRQKLVIRHERRHRDHAKSNFDKVKGVLRTSSQKRYGTESECFTAAKNDLDNATQEFRQLELIAANKVERGEL